MNGVGAEAPGAAEGYIHLCMRASPSVYNPLQRTALPCYTFQREKELLSQELEKSLRQKKLSRPHSIYQELSRMDTNYWRGKTRPRRRRKRRKSRRIRTRSLLGRETTGPRFAVHWDGNHRGLDQIKTTNLSIRHELLGHSEIAETTEKVVIRR